VQLGVEFPPPLQRDSGVQGPASGDWNMLEEAGAVGSEDSDMGPGDHQELRHWYAAVMDESCIAVEAHMGSEHLIPT
jgi:hypothetical protein